MVNYDLLLIVLLMLILAIDIFVIRVIRKEVVEHAREINRIKLENEELNKQLNP